MTTDTVVVSPRVAWRRFRAGIAVAIVVTAAIGVSGCGNQDDLEAPAPAPAPSRSAAQASAPSPAADDSTPKTSTILSNLNGARGLGRQCGSTWYGNAPMLKAQVDAEEAAERHTAWMQMNQVMSHTGAGGSSVGVRLTDAGYDWSAVGENVATGQTTAEAVVAAWLASPGHCANIMNPAFVDVGFAFATAGSGVPTYATMVLASPR